MTFEKMVLSGSTHGAPVVVAATAIGSGTTIHTATTSTTGFDDIHLWVNNTHSAAVSLTLGWGGTTDPDHLVMNTVSIPALSGLIPIVTGLLLRNGLLIRAAGSTASELLITGFALRAL